MPVENYKIALEILFFLWTNFQSIFDVKIFYFDVSHNFAQNMVIWNKELKKYKFVLFIWTESALKVFYSIFHDMTQWYTTHKQCNVENTSKLHQDIPITPLCNRHSGTISLEKYLIFSSPQTSFISMWRAIKLIILLKL